MKLKDVLYMNKRLNEPQMSCKMIVELRSLVEQSTRGLLDDWRVTICSGTIDSLHHK